MKNIRTLLALLLLAGILGLTAAPVHGKRLGLKGGTNTLPEGVTARLAGVIAKKGSSPNGSKKSRATGATFHLSDPHLRELIIS